MIKYLNDGIVIPFHMYADPKSQEQANPMIKLQFLIRHEVGCLAEVLETFIVSSNDRRCQHLTR